MKEYVSTLPKDKLNELAVLKASIADDPTKLFSAEWKQFERKQAWMLETDKYIFLRSYGDLVAVFIKEECCIYVFGRYSPTTSNHVLRLRREVLKHYESITMENCEFENWYVDGRLQEARENKRYGF